MKIQSSVHVQKAIWCGKEKRMGLDVLHLGGKAQPEIKEGKLVP